MNDAWTRFLDGRWQQEMPERIGEYPVATRSGDLGETRIVYRHEGKLHVANSVSGWGGWWWSEPLPDLPKPPPWDYDKA